MVDKTCIKCEHYYNLETSICWSCNRSNGPDKKELLGSEFKEKSSS